MNATGATETDAAFSAGLYERPTITYLGTLRELTLGGGPGPDDGNGGAGDLGSTP